MRKRPPHRLILALALLLAARVAPGRAAPRDIVLVLDNSGSMHHNDPKFLTPKAVRTFVEQLGGDIRLAVIVFDQSARLVVPLESLDARSRPRFLASTHRIDFDGRFTDSPAALERALRVLDRDRRTGIEKSIIFMTDGIVDTGDRARDRQKSRWLATGFATEAKHAGVRVFTIAFTTHADAALLRALAERTGGVYSRALRAADLGGVFRRIDANLNDTARKEGQPAPVPSTSDAAQVAPAPAPPAPQPATRTGTAGAGATASQNTAQAVLPPALPPLSAGAVATPAAPATAGGTAGADLSAAAPQTQATLPTPAAPPGPAAGVAEKTAAPSEAPGQLPAGSAPPAAIEPKTPAVAPVPAPVEAKAPPVSAAAPAPAETAASSEGTATAAASGTSASPAASPPRRTTRFLLWGGGSAAVAVVLAFVALGRKRRPRSSSSPPPKPTTPTAFLNDIARCTPQPSYRITADRDSVIGRLPGTPDDDTTHIVIDESTVGRRHAIISYRDHAFWLADQNSLNGTYVNRQRISQETRLKHGDRLRFHKFEFEFVEQNMFETDRTMRSETQFHEPPGEEGESTIIRRHAPTKRG